MVPLRAISAYSIRRRSTAPFWNRKSLGRRRVSLAPQAHREKTAPMARPVFRDSQVPRAIRETQGPQGDPGPQGIPGPKGDEGDSAGGGLAALDDLDGLPCDGPGHVALNYGPNGEVMLLCVGGGAGNIDGDGDGYTPNGGDCDDADPTRNPSASDDPSTPDGIDNDCDGLVDGIIPNCDDGNPGTIDSYDVVTGSCIYSFVPDGTPCNDGDPLTINDSYLYGICQGGTPVLDFDVDGYTVAAGDCDDADATVYPGAPELPDGKDNDCDQQIDEGTGLATAIDMGALPCDDAEIYQISGQIQAPGQVIVYRFYVTEQFGCQFDAVAHLNGDPGIVFDLQMDFDGILYQDQITLNESKGNTFLDDSGYAYIWVHGVGAAIGGFTLMGHW
jgi:Putative metal-binding motif